jgi:signal transduction histidine kinase
LLALEGCTFLAQIAEQDRTVTVSIEGALVGPTTAAEPAQLCRQCRDEDGVAHFTVSGTGPGIRAEDAVHVFDRFWKRDTGGKEEAELVSYVCTMHPTMKATLTVR